MTQRERHLLLVVLVLGGGLLLVVGVFAVLSIRDGLDQHNLQVAALTKDNDAQKKKLQDLLAAQVKLEQWRAISLPADASLASSRYKPFLKELCDRHQLKLRTPIADPGLRSTTGRTSNLVTPLNYTIQADGTLARLLGFLQEFYALNLPHILRELTVTPQGTGPEARLNIDMKIEVLSLPSATNRDFLIAVPDSRVLAIDVFMAMRHGPIGLGLAPWLLSPTGIHGARKLASTLNRERDYTKLIAKNVFVGLAAPSTGPSAAEAPRGDREVLKYVQLTGITGDFLKTEATLRNRLTGKYTRMRAEGGWDSFSIKDGSDREVLAGKVRHIEGRDVVFQVKDKHYRLHVGEFVEQALKKELSAEQLKALGVEVEAEAPAENP